MKRLTGIGVSKGIVAGPARVYRNARVEIEEGRDQIPYQHKQRFLKAAIEKVTADIRECYECVKAANLKQAEIFEAHTLFLKDPVLLDKIDAMFREGYDVTCSVRRSFEESAEQLERIEDA
jgi:phosphoenolpyruvate-protein kinase (PTS system EI component)